MGTKITMPDGSTKTLTGTKAPKGAPRSKRPGANNGPARLRYRTGNKLMERKIRNLMRCCRMTRAQATLRWMNTRKRGRVAASATG